LQTGMFTAVWDFIWIISGEKRERNIVSGEFFCNLTTVFVVQAIVEQS